MTPRKMFIFLLAFLGTRPWVRPWVRREEPERRVLSKTLATISQARHFVTINSTLLTSHKFRHEKPQQSLPLSLHTHIQFPFLQESALLPFRSAPAIKRPLKKGCCFVVCEQQAKKGKKCQSEREMCLFFEEGARQEERRPKKGKCDCVKWEEYYFFQVAAVVRPSSVVLCGGLACDLG